MTRLSIDIPDDLRAKMELRAAETGHASLEAYLAWLAREDADSVDYGAPAHLQPQSIEHLEAMLLESMKTPGREMTAADWDEKRRRLNEKYGQQKAG